MIRRSHTGVQTWVFLALMVLVLCLISVGPSHAIPLSGDYFVSSGALSGSTFTVDPTSHLMTHWNLIFPIAFTSTGGLPAFTFTDPNITDPSGGNGTPFINDGDGSFITMVFIPEAFPNNNRYIFGVSNSETLEYAGVINKAPNIFTAYITSSGVVQTVPEPGSSSALMIGLLVLAGAHWWTHRSEGPQRG